MWKLKKFQPREQLIQDLKKTFDFPKMDSFFVNVCVCTKERDKEISMYTYIFTTAVYINSGSKK